MPMTVEDWKSLREEFAADLDDYMEEWERSLRAKMNVDKSERFGEPRLLTVPDVPQDDSASCGAAAYKAVANFFGTGPDTMDEARRDVSTDPENGTPPANIIRALRKLGLKAEGRQEMTLADLRDCWESGSPVICPIQDYGPDAGPDDWDDGHYVTVVGLGLGFVFVQDSMEDVELEGANSDAEPGRVMIEQQRFLDVWHDRGADGTEYQRFGIIVSKLSFAELERYCGGKGGKPGPCPENGPEKSSIDDKSKKDKINQGGKNMGKIIESQSKKLEKEYIDPDLPGAPNLKQDWSNESTEALMNAANWYAAFVHRHSGKLMKSDAVFNAANMAERLTIAVRYRFMKPLLDEAHKVAGIDPEVGVRMTNAQLKEAIEKSKRKRQ